MKKCKHIIISRTDSIGDVLLSLPLVGLIKQIFPGVRVTFLGQSYTGPILKSCGFIDAIIYWDELKRKGFKEKVEFFKSLEADTIIHVFPRKSIAEVAKEAGISRRIGTSRRLYHLLNCNELVNLSRKNSKLHEAQLNIKLLRALEYDLDCPLEDLSRFFGLNNIPLLDQTFENLLDASKLNLIIHPKSKGSAREWGIDNFSNLVEMLPQDKFRIFVTGTAAEGELIKDSSLINSDKVINLCGKLSLDQLIAFINKIDGIVACSTGPLHIAAILNKHAIGIYSPMKPIHPVRWAPIGPHAKVFVNENYCDACREDITCKCITGISPESIFAYLNSLIKAPVSTI